MKAFLVPLISESCLLYCTQPSIENGLIERPKTYAEGAGKAYPLDCVSAGKTFAWRTAKRDTPLHVLKELEGWEKMEMVQRNVHLSAGHLAQWKQLDHI